MKKLVLYLIVMVLMISGLSCHPTPTPVDPPDPKEPDEPPPPPPPPPNKSGSSPGDAIIIKTTSMDGVARAALAGEYGDDLKNLLADEVSRCIGKMAEESVVEVAPSKSSGFVISVVDNRPVLFDIGCIAEDVLQGKYGTQVRGALQSLLISSDSIDSNRNACNYGEE